MDERENKYREMLTKIYDNDLKYFAWKHYGQQTGSELLSDTITYFLEKYNTYKNKNYNQLTANTIIKIKNLLIDKIRKENSSGIFGEIYDVGNYLSLDVGDIISIAEIKNINLQLKKDNLKQIKYHVKTSTVSISSTSIESEISTTNDQEKHQKLILALKLLENLEGKCEELIKSQLLEELSYKEIQKKFNINSIGTVMSSISRCWDKLKKLKEKELQNA